MAEVGANLFAQTLKRRLQVKGDVRLRRVEFADQLAEEPKAVFNASLGQLVAEDLVQARHQEPVEDVVLVVERWDQGVRNPGP